MITNTIILLLLLAVAVMPVNIESNFTQEELTEMGIHLDDSGVTEAQ